MNKGEKEVEVASVEEIEDSDVSTCSELSESYADSFIHSKVGVIQGEPSSMLPLNSDRTCELAVECWQFRRKIHDDAIIMNNLNTSITRLRKQMSKLTANLVTAKKDLDGKTKHTENLDNEIVKVKQRNQDIEVSNRCLTAGFVKKKKENTNLLLTIETLQEKIKQRDAESLRKEKLHEKEVRDMKRLHDDREKANSDLVSSLETALNKTTHSQDMSQDTVRAQTVIIQQLTNEYNSSQKELSTAEQINAKNEKKIQEQLQDILLLQELNSKQESTANIVDQQLKGCCDNYIYLHGEFRKLLATTANRNARLPRTATKLLQADPATMYEDFHASLAPSTAELSQDDASLQEGSVASPDIYY